MLVGRCGSGVINALGRRFGGTLSETDGGWGEILWVHV